MKRNMTQEENIRRRKRRNREGFFTVEASLVIPLCIMVLSVFLALTLYLYQRCWYTQTMCEAAIQGSGYGVLKERDGWEKTKEKWEQRSKEKEGLPGKIEFSLAEDSDKIHCSVKGTIAVWGQKNLIFEKELQQKMIRPVSFVWKAAAIREGKEG